MDINVFIIRFVLFVSYENDKVQQRPYTIHIWIWVVYERPYRLRQTESDLRLCLCVCVCFFGNASSNFVYNNNHDNISIITNIIMNIYTFNSIIIWALRFTILLLPFHIPHILHPILYPISNLCDQLRKSHNGILVYIYILVRS